SSATLSYYNYAYDNADRVTSQTYSSQVGTTTYSATRNYSYDSTDQLLTDGSQPTYSYDANGNRTMAGDQTGTGNRLTSDGTYTYSFDAEGNLVGKTKGAGQETTTYTYNTLNQLTNILKTSDGTTTVLNLTYTYDVDGKRVQQDKWTPA